MENTGIFNEFEKDEVYKLFLTDDFDVKAVTSSAVQLVAVTEHLVKLSAGINLLDKELHHQVANHYEDLLCQATEIETLEGVLHMVNGKIEVLLSSADRLRCNVVDPYDKVSRQTTMLVRLQITCDLLRRVIRVMQLCRRLEMQLQGNTDEIVKAAQSLSNLDYLMEGVDFNGLHIIETNLQLIKKARNHVLCQANILLVKGIESQHGLDVSTALQVFHHLQVLKATIHKILQETKNKVCQNIIDALDVAQLSCQSQDNVQKVYGPGRAAIPLTGNTAAFRARLWANMEDLMNTILASFCKIQHLQDVIFKKKDSANASFVDDMTGDFDLVWSLWSATTITLTEEFSRAANESSYIKQAFEVEFPKLLCMFNECFKSLCEQGCYVTLMKKISEDEKTSDSSRNPEDSWRTAISPFETAYLSRCRSRLIDSVNVVCGSEGQTAPTTEDIEGIVKAMQSELSAANIDPVLVKNIATNVAYTVDFFLGKSKSLISSDSDSNQVISQPASTQLLNAHVIHLLHILHKQLFDIIQSNCFTEDVVDVIKLALEPVNTVMEKTIEPLFQSIFAAVKAIIVTMHKEDFSLQAVDEKPECPCSLYMEELQRFIVRSQSDYISLYPICDAVNKSVHDLASNTIEVFVRHISLIRPLGDGGKMRLAADCAQMEMALSTWCNNVGELGKSYKLLRSFRPLLFQTSNHVALSTAIGEILPYSIALQFLFAKAPQELKSPHDTVGWTVEEYSNWLDQHASEKERLVLIKGSLEKYVTWIKQKQNKEFCSVYPVIVEVLQKGLQEHS